MTSAALTVLLAFLVALRAIHHSARDMLALTGVLLTAGFAIRATLVARDDTEMGLLSFSSSVLVTTGIWMLLNVVQRATGHAGRLRVPLAAVLAANLAAFSCAVMFSPTGSAFMPFSIAAGTTTYGLYHHAIVVASMTYVGTLAARGAGRTTGVYRGALTLTAVGSLVSVAGAVVALGTSVAESRFAVELNGPLPPVVRTVFAGLGLAYLGASLPVLRQVCLRAGSLCPLLRVHRIWRRTRAVAGTASVLPRVSLFPAAMLHRMLVELWDFRAGWRGNHPLLTEAEESYLLRVESKFAHGRTH